MTKHVLGAPSEVPWNEERDWSPPPRPPLRWYHYLGPAAFLGLPILAFLMQFWRAT